MSSLHVDTYKEEATNYDHLVLKSCHVHILVCSETDDADGVYCIKMI